MPTIDLKKELKHLYSPSATKVSAVSVPEMQYLMTDGEGDPNNSPSFHDAVGALYSLAYTLKFHIKKLANAVDYGVMPLEGLWSTADGAPFTHEVKTAWHWTVMIMQPHTVTADMVETQIRALAAKRKTDALARIRFESLHEGDAAQIMHIGPYAAEQPTIDRVNAFIRERGSTPRGRHHEIYLGDPRKSAPEKLRTIIRQPFK